MLATKTLQFEGLEKKVLKHCHPYPMLYNFVLCNLNFKIMRDNFEHLLLACTYSLLLLV
jgi:hypothetical protein